MRPVVSMTTICEMLPRSQRDATMRSPACDHRGSVHCSSKLPVGQRRHAFAIGRDANETRGAGNDLRGDDLAVGADVRAGESLPERELMLAAAALNPEVRSLLVGIHEVELRRRAAIRRRAARWAIGCCAGRSAFACRRVRRDTRRSSRDPAFRCRRSPNPRASAARRRTCRRA